MLFINWSFSFSLEFLGWQIILSFFFFLFLFFYFILFFCFFRAALAAYGSSQGRDRIRGAAAGLHHSLSNAGSKLHLRSTPQLMAMPPNP